MRDIPDVFPYFFPISGESGWEEGERVKVGERGEDRGGESESEGGMGGRGLFLS